MAFGGELQAMPIGRLLNHSINNVGAAANAGVKGAGETLGATSSAAGDLARGVSSGVTDAAGTVAHLPLSNVVAGFQRCAIAGNGAPDCGVRRARAHGVG